MDGNKLHFSDYSWRYKWGISLKVILKSTLFLDFFHWTMCNVSFIIFMPIRIPRIPHKRTTYIIVPDAWYHHTNCEDILTKYNNYELFYYVRLGICYYVFCVLYCNSFYLRNVFKIIFYWYEINVYLTWKLNYTLCVRTAIIMYYCILWLCLSLSCVKSFFFCHSST